MTTNTTITLEPGALILAHDGPHVPYLTFQTRDYREAVHVFLGDPLALDELPAALRQLDDLEAAIITARRLLAAHAVRTPDPGPDDPDDGDPDPVDELTPAQAWVRGLTGDQLRELAVSGTIPERGLAADERLRRSAVDQAHPMTESELRYAHGDR